MAVSRRSLVLAGALLPGLCWSQPDWPSRPLRIIVPFVQGGATDLLARAIADELQAGLGQRVFIDNRAGGGGNVGAVEVARATDGHTLLMGTVGMLSINTALYGSRLPYNPGRDFAPITLIASVPNVLVVNRRRAGELGIASVPDLIRVAQANPNLLKMASAGNGTSTHLVGEWFKKLTHTAMPHFPYRGSGPALLDMADGIMDVMFDSLLSGVAYIRSGQLMPLAMISATRSGILPEVPTIEEAGGPLFTGFESSSWTGLLAPSATPAERVARLQRETSRVLAKPALRQALAALGALPSGSSSAEFIALIEREHRKWEQIVALTGARPD
jgi:tripartite-type tricarboxylate transporter receptor subunit TctC